MEKTCRKCNLTADDKLFTWSARDGYTNVCKQCSRDYAKLKRTDTEFVYRQKARKYNTSVEVVKELFEKNDTCQICNQKCFRELCVDHCHTTGQVRGLLCDTCNKGLGLFKDNPKLLKNAIEYLGD